MLSRMVRAQLAAFFIVTVVALTLVAVFFIRVPQQLGAGEYRVSLELPEAGGLYDNAIVTYRGVDIGRVKDVEATEQGAKVSLAIDEAHKVPSDVTAEVHSTSAVGEQYVNLVPRGTDGGEVLAEGSRIGSDRAQLPVSTPQLLDNVNNFAAELPKDSLATTVDEMYKAFNGTGEDLTRLLDAGMQVQDNAEANLDPTLKLLDDLVPVLDTQREVRSDVESYTTDLASFTSQLAASDGTIRQTIQRGSPFAQQIAGAFDDLRPILPALLANFATVGKVTSAYAPGIEHVLIVLPATMTQMLNAALLTKNNDELKKGNVSFKLPVNNPPVCTQGFENAEKHRDPNDLSPAPISLDSYCKVAHDDPRVVRGARNNPCPNDPSRRAPTAAECGLVFDRVEAPDAPPEPQKLAPDPDTGRAMAPNDPFYKQNDLNRNSPIPSTWEELLKDPLNP